MAENKEIPENADKILFAEDLMNHVLGHSIDTTYSTVTAEIYRDSTYNAFNETIKAAVNFLYYKVITRHEDFFYCMAYGNTENVQAYTRYVDNIRKKYLTDAFNAGGFLHFCVSLAGGALHFYKKGILEVPSVAVKYIVSALNNVDMANGGWNMLNTAAEKFAYIKYDPLNEPYRVLTVSVEPTFDEGAHESSSSSDKEDSSPNTSTENVEESSVCNLQFINEDSEDSVN